MSQEDVELHRRSVEAFNTRDVENFVAFCDPHIELHSTVTVPGGAVYQGHDGVRRWHRDLADGWGDELRVEPEAYFDLGEHTISFHVLHGRGRQSGADVAMPAAHLCRWRDGLIVNVFPDASVFPEAGSLVGCDKYRSLLEDSWSAWASCAHTREEVLDIGDGRVLIRGGWGGKGIASGVEAYQSLSAIFTVRDRQISNVEYFFDHAEALKAVGLAG